MAESAALSGMRDDIDATATATSSTGKGKGKKGAGKGNAKGNGKFIVKGKTSKKKKEDKKGIAPTSGDKRDVRGNMVSRCSG